MAAALKAVLHIEKGPQWNQSQWAATTTIPLPPQEIEAAPLSLIPPNIDAAENEQVNEDKQVNTNVNLVISGSTTLIEEQIKLQVFENLLTDTLPKKYLERIGIKPAKYRRNADKFKKWLEEDPLR